ncbi:MAG: biopolymer transport protein TolR [Rhodospirillaceae bacterium]|nr:MAG: biopolymer transport protein TolR [Rhodospirillaceae bacterium]
MLTGSPGREGRKRTRPMADINVTPMVDVMLVLLVIFMVTAPLLVTGVQVDLPKTAAGSLKGDDRPLTVTVNGKGQVFIHETLVKIEDLGPRLVAIAGQKPETRIFIRGDKGLQYGRVMEVMGAVTAAGFSKVALVAEMPETVAPKGRKGSP